MFYSTKTYGHEQGLSCVFRQYRAKSHCQKLHGYAISVSLKFGAEKLDDRNWVVDFGGLKPVKAWLQSMFDHKVIVAEDDPMLDDIGMLAGLGVADVVTVPATGCEAFAALIFQWVTEWMRHEPSMRHAFLTEVTVAEHAGNSATVSI